MPNRISDSLSVNDAVGSSRISSLQSVIMARMISRHVFWGGLSCEAAFVRSISIPSSCALCCTRSFICFQSMVPPLLGYSIPRYTFSTALNAGISTWS